MESSILQNVIEDAMTNRKIDKLDKFLKGRDNFESTLELENLLCFCCILGDRDIVECLLQNGVDPNTEKKKFHESKYDIEKVTPVGWCIKKGRYDISEILIKYGAQAE